MQIEVEATRAGRTIGGRRHGNVHQTAHRHAAGVGDAEKKPQLLMGVQARHGDDDLGGVPASRLPHRLQVGMSEIRCPKVGGEGPGEGSLTEDLPESAVETAWFQTCVASCIEPHVERVAIDDGEPGTRCRYAAAGAHHHEPRVHQLQGKSFHGAQALRPWCPGDMGPAWRWRIRWLST